MKVNTDGILLGAWAHIGHAKNILDIGTGTGLIALMLAQRSQTLTDIPNISALEIDLDAYLQAQFNVDQSPWASQVTVFHHDFLTWQHEQKIEKQCFDLLVSNPPYFEDSLLSASPNKNLARHTKHMGFEQLLQAADNLLSDEGEFNLILPIKQAELVIELALSLNMQLTRQTRVKTTPKKPISRLLFCLRKTTSPLSVMSNDLTIRDENNQYSAEYKALCKAFYVKM